MNYIKDNSFLASSFIINEIICNKSNNHHHFALKMEVISGIRTNVLWVEEHPASGFANNFFQGVSVVVGVGKDGGGHHASVSKLFYVMR